MDVTLRSDLIVRDLLRLLDERVGKGNYVLAMTADHGVCPLPEVARQHGHEAERVSARQFASGAKEFLAKKFGRDVRWIEANSGWWIYSNSQAIKEHGLKSTVVERALADWLTQSRGSRPPTRALS